MRPSETDAERLLVGKAPTDDPSLADVAAFVRSVRGALVEPPAEEVAAGHLGAMAEATRSQAPRPVAAPPRRRLRLVARPGMVAASTAMASALCFALAAIGALPDPVQARFAEASRVVGIRLPRPEPTKHPKAEPPARPPAGSRGTVPPQRAPIPVGPAPTTPEGTAPEDQRPDNCTPAPDATAPCEEQPTEPGTTTPSGTPPETQTEPSPEPGQPAETPPAGASEGSIGQGETTTPTDGP